MSNNGVAAAASATKVRNRDPESPGRSVEWVARQMKVAPYRHSGAASQNTTQPCSATTTSPGAKRALGRAGTAGRAATSPRSSGPPPSRLSWRARSIDRLSTVRRRESWGRSRARRLSQLPVTAPDLDVHTRVRDADLVARSRSIAADRGGHVGILRGDPAGLVAVGLSGRCCTSQLYGL